MVVLADVVGLPVIVGLAMEVGLSVVVGLAVEVGLPVVVAADNKRFDHSEGINLYGSLKEQFSSGLFDSCKIGGRKATSGIKQWLGRKLNRS